MRKGWSPKRMASPLFRRNSPAEQDWARSVEDSVRTVKSTHTVEGVGYRTLKFWMVDPG
jgi:hypothetical protein